MIPFAIPAILKAISPTNWLIIGMGITIASLSTALWVQGVRLDSAKNEAKKQELISRECFASIDRQNLKIEELASTRINLEKDLGTAREINVSKSKELLVLLKAIKNKPIPKDSDIKGQLEYIVNVTKEHAIKWNTQK